MARMPKLTSEQREAIEKQDCTTCGKPASDSISGRNGLIHDPAAGTSYAQCTDCWNASVEQDRQQRAAELAARPRCEACQRRPQTWTMRGSDGPVSVCGACKGRVNRVIRAPMLFGPPSASRARILEVARGA